MTAKMLNGNYVVSVGEISTTATNKSVVEIDYEEETILINAFYNRPEAPEGYAYLLRADNLEWELVELPPEGDIDDAEAFDIIFGGEA